MQINSVVLNGTTFKSNSINTNEQKSVVQNYNYDLEESLAIASNNNKTLINFAGKKFPKKFIEKTLEDGSKVKIEYNNDGKIRSSAKVKHTPDVFKQEIKQYNYENGELKDIQTAKETRIINTKNGKMTNPLTYVENVESRKDGSSTFIKHETVKIDETTKEEKKFVVEKRFVKTEDGTILKFYSQKSDANEIKIVDFKTQDGTCGKYDLVKNRLQEVVFPKDEKGTSISISRFSDKDDEFVREIKTAKNLSILEYWENNEVKRILKTHQCGSKTIQTLDGSGHVAERYCNSDLNHIFSDATLHSKTLHVHKDLTNGMSVPDTIKAIEGFISERVDSVN